MKTTDLLERYLQAVRYWLPRAQQQDIIAELSEEIRSQIEEKEGELGREADQGDLEAILKSYGSPMFVANRYLPQRYLIGPLLYPLYLSILKWFVLIWVLPLLLIWLGSVLFSPEYRGNNPGQHLRGLWLSILSIGFNTTLGFALVERFVRTKAWESKDWSPRQLPPLSQGAGIARSNSLFALAWNLTLLVWGLLHIPAADTLMSYGTQITLAPVWPLFFWSILLLLAVRLALWGCNLFRPYWTRPRLVFRLVIDCLASLAYGAGFKAHLVVAISAPNASAVKAAQDLDAFNAAMAAGFWVVLPVCLLAIVCDLRRLRVLGRPRAGLAPVLAALSLMLALAPRQAGAETTATTPHPSRSLPTDAEIRQMLVTRIETQQKSVGMVVGIITPQGRRIISHGLLNQGDARRLDGDTVFEVGSVTKVFTALLLTEMVERRELALTDPVAKYLPGVRVPERNGRKIALVDLATHTSGLPFFPSDIPLSPKEEVARVASAYPVEKLYRFVSGYTLSRDIGSQWEYSNNGMSLLGLALANRAGTNYPALLRTRITAPLGMRRTGIAVTPEMRTSLSAGHNSSLQAVPEVSIPAFEPAGALRSTANDLLAFLGAFTGMAESPLAPAMAAMLKTSRPGPSFSQRLGWWAVTFGPGEEPLITHEGVTPGFNCTVACDPAARVGVVVLSNSEENDGLAWNLLRPGFSSRAVKASGRKELALNTNCLTNYIGRYQPPPPGGMLTIERADDALVFRSEIVPQGLRIHAENECEFFVYETTQLHFTFQTDPQGYATNLLVQFAGTSIGARRMP